MTGEWPNDERVNITIIISKTCNIIKNLVFIINYFLF